MRPHHRALVLLLGLVVLASFAGRYVRAAEMPGASSNPPITVDGVPLGANLEEVEARWGPLDRYPGQAGGLFVLPAELSVGRSGQYAELDAEGRAHTVTGQTLRVGPDFTLKSGDYPARALHALGRPIRQARVSGGIRDDQVCWTFRKQGILIDVIGPESGDRRKPHTPDTKLKITEISISRPAR